MTWRSNREQRLEYLRQRYVDLKRLGICVDCGRELAFAPQVRCPSCIEKLTLRNAKRYNRLNKAKCLEKERIYRKKRREFLKEEGICPVCGKRKPIEGKVHCEICLEKRRYYDAQRSPRKRMKPQK